MRLAKLFEAYVKKIAPTTVELKLTRLHGGKPWMADFDSPYIRAAGRAIEKGLGKRRCSRAKADRFPWSRRSRRSSDSERAVRSRAPGENAHAPTKNSISQISMAGHRLRIFVSGDFADSLMPMLRHACAVGILGLCAISGRWAYSARRRRTSTSQDVDLEPDLEIGPFEHLIDGYFTRIPESAFFGR